jgi:UDP-glucose 4-epimerase
MVLPRFVGQALDGAPLTIFGTGEQSRCFAHVSDVAEAMVRLLYAPGAVGEVFNIGSREEVTIRQLAECVRDATGSRSPLVTVPYEQAYDQGFEDMPRRVPDVSKLEEATGYKPSTPLATIIEDVVAHQRHRRLSETVVPVPTRRGVRRPRIRPRSAPADALAVLAAQAQRQAIRPPEERPESCR